MAASQTLHPEHRQRLQQLARESIDHGLAHGEPLAPAPDAWPRELRRQAASFVTLTLHGQLRGCIGSIEARRTLIEDVAHNAYAAAFQDPRFPPCASREVTALELSLSVLGPLIALHFDSRQALLQQLRPHVDGLVIQAGQRRGVFLPQVWEQLPRPDDFLAALLRKAGLPGDSQPPALQAWRYTVEHF